MVRIGGAATLYGVLYQLLGSLHHTVRLLDIQRRGHQGAVAGARLTLEPAGGGGDIRIDGPLGQRIVEQWKARTSARPWGLQEVLKEVIPDLYKDPALNNPHNDTSYVFATEGRLSSTAQSFFERLRNSELADHSFARMSANDGRILRATATLLRRSTAARSEELSQIQRKLRRLLSRFEIRERQTAERLAEEIDSLLRPVVDHVDDLVAIRDHLCQILLRRSASHANNFMPEEILREAGVHGLSLNDSRGLQRASRQLLAREVSRRAKYDRDLDVRSQPDWPQDRRFLVLAGESGQGKTWQLCRLAMEIAQQEGRVVALVDWKGDAERTLQAISDWLWTQAWGHDRPISLQRLAARRTETSASSSPPPLVVGVDGVPSLRAARDLLAAFDWELWGVRLALATPPDGLALAEEDPLQTHSLRVLDFSFSELRDYLHRQGRALQLVPRDVRETLKRPLLARLYTTISANSEWAPRREYELYEGYWKWIQRVREQADYPEDFARVKRLAFEILDDDAEYPWTWSQLQAAGISPDSRVRLEAAGWWIRNPEGVEVWHDRLVSWAVAEAIIELAAPPEITGHLMSCLRSRKPRLARILGYVPMDVLWLLSGNPAKQPLLPDLMARLECEDAFGGRNFYANLLPTLGSRVFPGLIQRFKNISQERDRPFAQLATKSLSALITTDNSLKERLPELLEESGSIGLAAINVLATHPTPDAIQPLWHIHRRNALTLEERPEGDNYFSREKSFAALRACLDLAPEWLETKIKDADPDADAIWELAYLLAKLKNPSARELWIRVKAELKQKVPHHKRQSVIACIRAFRDRHEGPFLESWSAVEDDWTAHDAFRALAWVDPDRAIALLPTIPQRNLSNNHAGSWPVFLLAHAPDATRRALRDRLLAADADFWRVAELLRWYEDHLDEETLEILLDRLAQDAAGHVDSPAAARDALERPLRFLAQIQRLPLLRIFEGRAGTDLDRKLGDLGTTWLALPGDYDAVKDLRAILLKIGGEGFRQLIRAGLASADTQQRRQALAWGMACPDEVRSSVVRETWVLAALGEDEALVEDMLALEDDIDDKAIRRLQLLRRSKTPMTDSALAPALEALSSESLGARLRALAVIAISGRTDLLGRIPSWIGSTATVQQIDDRAALVVYAFASSNAAAARSLSEALDPDRHPATMAALLGENGAEELPGRLEEHLLQKVTSRRFDASAMYLALSLARSHQLNPRVSQAVWRYGKDNPEWNRRLLWSSVAQLEDKEVHDELFKRAADFHFHDERFDAIGALKLRDPEAAFESAALHLRGAERGKDEFVALLMTLDRARAIPLLIQHAAEQPATAVLWEIARALRRGGAEVEAELRKALESRELQARVAAAHLAGWQGPGFLAAELQAGAENDVDSDVRWECLWALERQRKEKHVIELMEAFPRVRAIARWSYLEAILELGDPRLLVTTDDILWLGRILTSESGTLEVHANVRLEDRFEDLKRRVEARDRDQRT